MSDTVIQVENLAKLYRLGQVGTGTIAHDLNRWWSVLRGKGDPFQKVGETNKRDEAGESQYVWALNDVDFEVKSGEVLGIIGNNGAGKSTLLKLLSRVTAPTRGKIKINGRVASLLEVGTGFHPELTGRENIYLNGAIMGMSKAEIRSRFDEIVDFSSCARYVDTPVKRFSSGMFVRLAFAVAAHLEPDILIVDEVLAVGDAEFQNRCIGKMKEVSEQGGRTVLFVSHNLTTIKRLCPKSILLQQGRLVHAGDTSDTLSKYLKESGNKANRTVEIPQTGAEEFSIESIRVCNREGFTEGSLDTSDEIRFEVDFCVCQRIQNIRINIQIHTSDGVLLFVASNNATHPITVESPGRFTTKCIVPPNLLNKGSYNLKLNADIPNERLLAAPNVELEFCIDSYSFDSTGVTYDATGQPRSPFGLIHPQLNWNVERR